MKLFGIRYYSLYALRNEISKINLKTTTDFKNMTQIRISDFCNKYGFTLHQIRHATRTGKLDKVAKGIVDEEVALQIMLSYTKPKQPINPKVKQSTQTQDKPTFLSQEWVKSMIEPASTGRKIFPSDK
ncbi:MULTISPECIES: hypothetical protein [Acinetobacter]|uniref:hypothetical protein n=1 Tax=Acinetobacter TaxID=469 RepID=UPI00207B401D|nr:hypothetical protein [Acinetobacter baumannii]